MLDIDLEEDKQAVYDNKVLENQPIEGIFYDMSNEEYHLIEGMSSTLFQDLDLSVAIFDNRHLFKYVNVNFNLGNLIHTAILEPDKLDDYMETSTVTFDSKKTLQMIEDYPNKIIVPLGSITIAKEQALKCQLIYRNFLRDGKKEVSVIVVDEVTGLTFKCRTDNWLMESGVVLDVKSTKATNHAEFLKTLEAYNYDLSAAWYVDTCNKLIKKLKLNIPLVREFGWICIPKSEPYKPFGFKCSQELMEKGRSKYQDLLNKYIGVKQNGDKDELFKTAYSYQYRKENFI